MYTWGTKDERISSVLENKRAQSLYNCREEESSFTGLFKYNQSEYV